jgi:hypothetical protein
MTADNMAITPPETSPYHIRLDIQAECKRYVNAKEDLESAKVEVEENEANIKTTLEYLRTEYDLEDIEEIERIANDRDFT